MRQPKSKPAYKSLWDERASERAIVRDQVAFLSAIWTPLRHTDIVLYGALCLRRRGSSRMMHHFVPINEVAAVRKLLHELDRGRYDQYFCPNVYTAPDRKLAYVHRSWLGWCDVDDADPFAFEPHPSVIWQTSPDRSQAMWFWHRSYKPEKASAFSKALTYRFGGDKGGSAANKLLRLPGSYNHKPDYRTPFIPLLHFDPQPIATRPMLLEKARKHRGVQLGSFDERANADGRLTILRKYRSRLDPDARRLIQHDRVFAPDRSLRIFQIVAGLHCAGATESEIANVVWHSPYFRDKYGDDLNSLEIEVSRILSKVGGSS